jgi:hypothetical protein
VVLVLQVDGDTRGVHVMKRRTGIETILRDLLAGGAPPNKRPIVVTLRSGERGCSQGDRVSVLHLIFASDVVGVHRNARLCVATQSVGDQYIGKM